MVSRQLAREFASTSIDITSMLLATSVVLVNTNYD